MAIGEPGSPGFGPFRAAFLRFLVAGVVLYLWARWREPRDLEVRKADWPVFVRLAALGMGLTYVFNYTGLALSTGTAAALIMATEPVWIALLAVLLLRERLTVSRGLGVALGMAGTVLVVLSTRKAGGGAAEAAALWGNVLLVLSLLWESFAVLTVKQLTTKYSGRTVVTYEFLIGSAMLLPFALWEQWRTGVFAPSAPAWWAFLYLLVPCTLIAYTLWFRLLETVDAADVTVFIFLQPVVGALLGILWKGDPYTSLTVIGAVLVLSAMGCILYQPRPPKSDPANARSSGTM
jgi:drug/metabolite transporter (DMT)-like permease